MAYAKHSKNNSKQSPVSAPKKTPPQPVKVTPKPLQKPKNESVKLEDQKSQE